MQYEKAYKTGTDLLQDKSLTGSDEEKKDRIWSLGANQGWLPDGPSACPNSGAPWIRSGFHLDPPTSFSPLKPLTDLTAASCSSTARAHESVAMVPRQRGWLANKKDRTEGRSGPRPAAGARTGLTRTGSGGAEEWRKFLPSARRHYSAPRWPGLQPRASRQAWTEASAGFLRRNFSVPCHF